MIITDFDKVAFHDVSAVFDLEVQVHKCLFHFVQLMWRMIQTLGLNNCSKENAELLQFFAFWDTGAQERIHTHIPPRCKPLVAGRGHSVF